MIATHSIKSKQSGFALLEVVITIFILAIGLLGIAGLQVRLHATEMESYERSQALILVNDMANRITSNRNAAASYVTASPLGVGATCVANPANQVQRDTGEWCNALQGAAEVTGANKVGAMIGGRGCVNSLGNGKYMITVAWQGLVPIAAPPLGVTCGQGLYDNGTSAGSCINDLCRRYMTTVVMIATLS